MRTHTLSPAMAVDETCLVPSRGHSHAQGGRVSGGARDESGRRVHADSLATCKPVGENMKP